MKLSAAFSLLSDLRIAFAYAALPTFKAICRSPLLIFQPGTLSRTFMANVWIAFGPGVDENGRPVKQRLITPYAYGVVLDLGAGHGHTVNHLDHTKVTRYIALEPNTLMHPYIRDIANKAGYTEHDGTLLILACGAQDTEHILSAIGSQVDTLISILTLCTVPAPQQTISAMVTELIKPSGQLLYYEHVLSHRQDVAWWQRLWAPIWQMAFDGCRIDRPSHLWVEEVVRGDGESAWDEVKVCGKEGESEENLFWHRVGRCVKRGSEERMNDQQM
ncbi:hypothetical protein AX17_004281 [Amanita inopinata Kibby_2008]|nr:hypothetical protein AX17_004281 [Amanita inopinata Kibby_2008]